MAAHVSPAFRVEDGDTVTVGQCRPLSKTVSSQFLQMSWKADKLTNLALGSIQRSASTSEDRLSCEGVPEVLSNQLR